MDALMASSSKMSLVQTDEVQLLQVDEGPYTVASLPTKPFRKYVQRTWNSFDVITGWTGELPDLNVVAA